MWNLEMISKEAEIIGFNIMSENKQSNILHIFHGPGKDS